MKGGFQDYFIKPETLFKISSLKKNPPYINIFTKEWFQFFRGHQRFVNKWIYKPACDLPTTAAYWKA